MDYEKRYNELIDAIKKMMEANPHDEGLQNWVQDNVPELTESEDEKVRKSLIELFKDMEWDDSILHDYGMDKNKTLAWLEKQGCHKEFTFKSIPRLLEMIEPTNRAKSYCQKLIDSLLQEGYTTDAKIVSDCLKQMKGEKVGMATMDEQKSAWSEEDEQILLGIIDEIEANKNEAPSYDIPTYDKFLNWLKSLKKRIKN